MKFSTVLLSVVCILPLLPCCAGKPTSQEDTKKTAPKKGPQLIGRIASIPKDRRFVLIQSYGKWTLDSGAILTTRGPDDRTANLRTTGEKLGEFAAADLQSGTVEMGDAVYSQHVPTPETTVSSAEPEVTEPELPNNEEALKSENVQKNN